MDLSRSTQPNINIEGDDKSYRVEAGWLDSLSDSTDDSYRCQVL